MQKIIQVTGTYYEVGFQIGQNCKEAMHNILQSLQRFQFLKQNYADCTAVQKMKSRAQTLFPKYCEELQGIADGAEMSFDDIFLWNCRGDFPKDKDDDIETAGCTDVLIAGKNGQDSIIAHNEDGNADFLEHSFIVDATYSEDGQEHRIESFAYPGLLIGHTFAANSHGLVLTVNHLPWFEQREDVPRHFICRAILDCKTQQEALAVIKEYPSSGGFNYNIGQAGVETLLSVEAPTGSHETVKVTDRFTHANHCIAPAHGNLSQDTRGSTMHRQKRAEELLPSIAPTVEGALRILFDKDDKDLPILRDASGADKGVATIMTAVFTLNQQGVHWTVYNSKTQRPMHRGSFI